MALKLVRHAGTITASTMGDDAAHGLELGKLVKGHAVRVSEFAGQDIFIKVTGIDAQTAVTSSNGMYVKEALQSQLYQRVIDHQSLVMTESFL